MAATATSLRERIFTAFVLFSIGFESRKGGVDLLLCLPHLVALEGFYRPLRELHSPTALLCFWLPEGEEAIAVVDARAAGDESSASGSSQGNVSISLQACLKAASHSCSSFTSTSGGSGRFSNSSISCSIGSNHACSKVSGSS
jgi:hypothetical protein